MIRRLAAVLGMGLTVTACAGGASSSEVTFVGPGVLHPAGFSDVDLGTDRVAIGLVEGSTDDLLVAAYPDQLVRIESDGASRPILEVDPPAFGVETAPAADGTALTLVTTSIGDLSAHTRVVWVSDDVEVLLDQPGNLTLVGVIDDGVVIRDLDRDSALALVGFDGSTAGLGIGTGDAVVIPRTANLIANQQDDGRLVAYDLDTGDSLDITGLPPDAVMTQVAASPTASALAVALSTGEGEPPVLWTITGAEPEATQVTELDPTDVVAGYSDDGRWLYLVTDGTRHGSEVVAVELETGTIDPVDLPADATPLGWSRTVLTLQSIRPSDTG